MPPCVVLLLLRCLFSLLELTLPYGDMSADAPRLRAYIYFTVLTLNPHPVGDTIIPG
jgi:hypothetical protein